MTPTNIGGHGEAAGQPAVNPVTGSATIQPGTFHEPGHEREALRERSSGSLAGRAEEAAMDAWSQMTACMSRYPLAVFATALGLGFLLGRWGRGGVGFAGYRPRARTDWRYS